ncbi:MAG: CapA family protein [Patescibacteria group bacterium]
MPTQTDTLLPAIFPFPQKQETKTITLLFAGDIILDRGVEWQIQKNGGNWHWPFLKVADTLQKADLAFANLESQISDKGHNVGSIYSFRADPQSVEGLVYAGFDVLSVVNNHSFDYTKEAFEDSIARIQKAGIAPLAQNLVIREVESTKIGFLAYSNFPGPALVNWDNFPEVIQDIQNAKSQVDILVVSLHAGVEYAKEPDEFQNAFAQDAIDAGADLIVGHHPHVVQPLEQYKQGWITYSLGNFVFDQDFSKETMAGAMLKVIVEDKKIKEVSLLPTKINSSLQVEL